MSLVNEARGMAGEDLPWPVLRAIVLMRDEFTCAMCGGYATQVDHILARVHGGSDHLLNLQAACKPCNQSKGNALLLDRPRFFVHLNREQTFHLADEIEDARDRLTAEMRMFFDLADQRRAAQSAEPVQ